MKRLFRLVVLALAFGGCIISNSEESGTGSIAAREIGGGDDPGVASIAGSVRAVDIAGEISTGSPCQTFRVEHERAAGIIHVRIVARTRPGWCTGNVVRYAYDAKIGGIPSGRYSVRITHTYENTGWPAESVAMETVHVD